jgi:GMP synthase-like glutamine amidotransferase
MRVSVLYIDIEHDRVRCDPRLGPAHAARLETARCRLEVAAGQPCHALHFSQITPMRVGDIAPAAIVISGCTTDWAEYDFATLEGLLATIRETPVPILGICGGHQLIGFAHGGAWGPLGALEEGDDDPDPSFAPGQRKQRGFMPVAVDGNCRLFEGLGNAPTFFQSHYWQLTETPPGFINRASSPWSTIQAIERIDRPVYAVQFHPERYDADHPDGERLLRNFFAT